MENAFLLLASLFFLLSEARASSLQGCQIRIASEYAIDDGLSVWGKLVDVIDSKNSSERKLVFEPKTTFSGPRLKKISVFQKKDCPLKLTPGAYFHVSLKKGGNGTFHKNPLGVSKLFPDGKKEVPAKPGRYPEFEPVLSPICGPTTLQNYKSGDLFTLASPTKVEIDKEYKMRIITFKVEKVWMGPKLDSFILLEKIGSPCPAPDFKGAYYPMILQAADSKYYYLHCCNSLGATSKSFEPNFPLK